MRAQVQADIVQLWAEVLSAEFQIELKDAPSYAAVLVVPDAGPTSLIKALADIVLKELRFSSVILMQESVCCTFGAGISAACVVDIGEHGTSVSCVEDGLIVPNTCIQLGFGGRDITSALNWMLMKVSMVL